MRVGRLAGLFVEGQREREGRWRVDHRLAAAPDGAIRVVEMKANFTRSDLAHRSTYVISAFAYRLRVVWGVVKAGAQRRTHGFEEQGRLRVPCYTG